MKLTERAEEGASNCTFQVKHSQYLWIFPKPILSLYLDQRNAT